VVGRRHGAVGGAAHDPDRAAGGAAGNLTGCRTGLVLALITMITSEMIARQSGAGNILFNALDMGQYDTVYAMIIIIGAMGIGLDAAFEKLRGRLVKWSEPGFDVPLSFA
jgi:NitT/TauT family transport system permease protein